ncbi:hypothetical protein EVA_11112 [gut metagenome]|uniref:Uncharacterized protein n=1 Tax=gut metagenome TaxID=749906 RepID=J9GG59_9ZZZZ
MPSGTCRSWWTLQGLRPVLLHGHLRHPALPKCGRSSRESRSFSLLPCYQSSNACAAAFNSAIACSYCSFFGALPCQSA